jgi:hypothetical protein
MPIRRKNEQEEDKPMDEIGETALLPVSLLHGQEVTPGDEITLRVVHVYEDEVEVAYGAEEKETEPMADAEAALDAVAQEESDYP